MGELKIIREIKDHFLDLGIPENIIKGAIQEFVFQDLAGNYDSVVTAALQEKYDLETLKAIFRLGLKQYLAKLMERSETNKNGAGVP